MAPGYSTYQAQFLVSMSEHLRITTAIELQVSTDTCSIPIATSCTPRAEASFRSKIIHELPGPPEADSRALTCGCFKIVLRRLFNLLATISQNWVNGRHMARNSSCEIEQAYN